MPPTDDPHPIVASESPEPIQWHVRRSIKLGTFAPPLRQDFAQVVENRRSARKMARISFREMSNVLSFALQPRFFREGDAAGRHRSPTISAGALHGVELVIVDWRGSKRAFRFDRASCCLQALTIDNPSAMSRFVAHFKEVLAVDTTTAVVMLGDWKRMSAFYTNPETLLFRDAGAILQSLSMAAAAYRVGFCPLGILGGEIVEALGMMNAELLPAGVAAIGTIAY